MGRLKRLAILGSTGSIGTQTLDLVRAFPDRLQVVGLAAGRNRELLLRQIAEFHPRIACLEGNGSLPGVQRLSLAEMAVHPEVDLVVVATSGKAGLLPTLAALQEGKQVALANKEVLVMAGELVSAAAGGRLLPVDSEASALWQCLQGEDRQVARLIITASGGPFRDRSPQELAAITPEQALRHPTWKMGRKVTVDSATLMNKGMEVIEAHWLFGFPLDKIRVTLHPQSVVHSLVEFVDGSLKAQLSYPDMRLPILYALSHPERWSNQGLPRLDLEGMRGLTFERLEEERFPCFRLALEAGRRGSTYPAVLCAADEVAVELFLEGRSGFLDIPRLVERALEAHRPGLEGQPSLEDILAADAWAREAVLPWAKGAR